MKSIIFIILCFNSSGSEKTVSSRKGPVRDSRSLTPNKEFNKPGAIFWVT